MVSCKFSLKPIQSNLPSFATKTTLEILRRRIKVIKQGLPRRSPVSPSASAQACRAVASSKTQMQHLTFNSALRCVAAFCWHSTHSTWQLHVASHSFTVSHSSCQALLVSARPWVRALGSQAASDLHEGLAARTSCKQIHVGPHVGSHETVWSRNFYFRSGNLDVNNMSTAQFGFRFQPWCANPFGTIRMKELARVAGNESLRSCWKNMFFASCRKFHAAAWNVARNIIDMLFISFHVVPSSEYNPIDLSVCVNTPPCKKHS